MRALLLDQYSDPGGAQQALVELLAPMRDRAWEVLVGLPGGGPLFDSVRRAGFDVERVHCGPYRSGPKSPLDLARFVSDLPRLAAEIRRLERHLPADIIYINGPRLLPAAALARPRAPVLFHSHSYLFPGIVRQAAGISLQRMNASLLGICDFVTDPWRPYVPPERTSIVYNGVAGPRHFARPPANRSPLVGCIGRIAPEKGQRQFVAAAALIHRAIPECRFAVFGDVLFAEPQATRYAEKVRADAAALPVDFHGWVDDVYSVLANLDLVLVPSAGHEATTRVILESFAAGVPVIAFRSGGIPEVVEHGRGGWLATSTDDMAQLAIDYLRAGPAHHASASRIAREVWNHRFTLERFQRDVLDAMERVAGHARRVPARL